MLIEAAGRQGLAEESHVELCSSVRSSSSGWRDSSWRVVGSDFAADWAGLILALRIHVVLRQRMQEDMLTVNS
jgi:hypothetical protein